MKQLFGKSNGKTYTLLKRSNTDPSLGYLYIKGWVWPQWCTFEYIWGFKQLTLF